MNNEIVKQEKLFNKYQEKIKNKNMNKFKSNRIKGFEKSSFLVLDSKEGFDNNAINDFEEIKNLQDRLNKLLEEYKNNNSSVIDKTREYSRVISKSNKYSNKNIRFNTGEVCYVTNQGIAKWIPSTAILDSIAGKQGCPRKEYIDVGIDWKPEYNNAGTIIPTEPPLLAGTPMTRGEACGNAGKNIYVSELNKMGYIDSNDLLLEYPADMIKGSDQYKVIENTDSEGNNFGGMPMQNSNVEQCKRACSASETCGGFVFDRTNNNCWLKNKNMYPVNSKNKFQGLDLYLRLPKVENNASCSKEIMEIDSIAWENYKKSSRNMTKDTICGLAKVTEPGMNVKNNLKTEIADVAKEIIDRINILGNSSTGLDSNMEKTKSQLLNNIEIYKKINEEYSKNKNTYAVNISGILTDSDSNVLQENYNYMFWSILAIGLIIIIMNMKNKSD